MKYIVISSVDLKSKNRGVQALGYGSIDLLKKALPEEQIDFTILSLTSLDADFEKRLRQRYVSIPKLIRIALSRFFRFLARNDKVIQKINEADIVFDLTEGDSFSDLYGGLKRFNGYLYLQKSIRSFAKRYIFLPQTIGPFRSRFNRYRAMRFLRTLDRVFVRDQISANLILKSGIDTDVLTDVSLFMKSVKPKGYDLSFRPFEYVAINVSGLLYADSYNKEYVNTASYKALVEGIVRKLLSWGENVLLIPHTYDANYPISEDDLVACLDVARKFNKRDYSGKLEVLQMNLSAPEVKYLLANAKFSIASRMHACLASLTGGTASLGIAYSYKFRGTFERFGMEKYVIGLHEEDNVSEERLSKLLKSLLREHGSIREQLVPRNKRDREETVSIIQKRLYEILG